MSTSAGSTRGDESLPRLRAPMAPHRLVAALDEAAKRGKLPEFEPAAASSAMGHAPPAPLFTMLAYGTPWDADLIGESDAPGRAADAPPADSSAARPATTGEATTVRFRLEFRRRQLVIHAVVLILTVEPGRYFMDEFLATFIPALHGHIPTWWWWYPLTILPIPWLWRGWVRKSRKTTVENARERIGQMAEIVGGEVVE